MRVKRVSIQYGECCKSTGVAITFTIIQIVLECCKSAGVVVAFTSSQIVLEYCKSAGVAVACTSSQIMIECCKSASVAAAFTRLVDGMSVLLERGRNSSTTSQV